MTQLAQWMAHHSSVVVDLFFVIAWWFPAAVVIGYVTRMVPRRKQEVLDTFFGGELNPDRWNEKNLLRHPAVVYLENDTAPTDASLRNAIAGQIARHQGAIRYLVPMLGVMLISACGLWLCRVWVHARWFEPVADAKQFPNTMGEAVVMALSGAYVWGIWEALDRAQQRNLTPEDLATLSFRWVVCIPIGYATSLIALGDQFAPAFAFAASVFPLRELRRVTRENTLKKMLGGAPAAAQQQELRTSIEGLGTEMASHLEELGVSTALDMAYANPIHIMVKTGVTIRTVLDWMDQALFVVYATGQRAALASLGLRCSIDVCEFVEDHARLGDPLLAEVAKSLKMPEQATCEFLRRFAEDPQVQHLYCLWYPDGRPSRDGA